MVTVTDIFHTYYDLCQGQHRQGRGGPSIGKAVELVEANAKSWGTGAANLWSLWDKHKDVAHLVTAATLVCGDVRTRSGNKPFGPFGLQVDQFGPFQMTMLMPDLILAVGLEFERHGLKRIPSGRSEPKFDPNTLWRIPPDINVVPLPPPSRNIRPQDLRVLNKRRAGNRGRVNRCKTTPVSF